MIKESRLQEILGRFSDSKILVIGDFYLDAYWMIDKTRSTLSLETPWHTSPVVDQHYSPGAAGTVTNNLNALEVGSVYVVGVIGEDGFGTTLVNRLNENGCITDFMIGSSDRVTPTYLKPIHRGYENVAVESSRFDIENLVPSSCDLEDQVIENLNACVPLVDGVIVGDQMPHDNSGVVTDRVREEICRLATELPEKVFYADSRTRIGQYKNLIIKPNRFEAKRAIEPEWTGEDVTVDEVKEIGKTLLSRTGQSLFITVGDNGIVVFDSGKISHVPGISVEGQVDPVGAGDSVSAGLVASLCCGGSYTEAAFIGNLVASVTVTKIGTTGTASPDEVIDRFLSL